MFGQDKIRQDKTRQEKTRHLQVKVDSEILIVSTAWLNPILSLVLKPLVRSNFHVCLDKTRQAKTRHLQVEVDSEISIGSNAWLNPFLSVVIKPLVRSNFNEFLDKTIKKNIFIVYCSLWLFTNTVEDFFFFFMWERLCIKSGQLNRLTPFLNSYWIH